MRTTLLILVLTIFASSCKKAPADPNQSIDEGKVKENIYISDEMGWTMQIPEGWEITAKDEKQQMQERGHEAISGTIGQDIDYSGLKNLIGFKKDLRNSFFATSEPFDLEYEGEWEENSKALKEILVYTYQEQGINVDTTATTIEKIGGLDFRTYTINVKDPSGKLLLSQILYARYHKGYDFGVNINYSDEKYKDEMLKVWRGSKFSK